MKRILRKISAAVTALGVMMSAGVFDIPGRVLALEAAETRVGTQNCDGNHEGMSAWTDENDLPTSGNYYLDTNVNLNVWKLISGSLTLCLNGHTVAAASGEHILSIHDSLTLCDCSSGKTGKLIGGSVSSSGGAVDVVGGTFTMNGGTISDNTAGTGGGVFVRSGASFIMNGGTISNNISNSHGGGVYSSGIFTMNGGAISGNRSNTNAGGGVFVASSGTFIMNGGMISSNTAYTRGGGVYVNKDGGTFTMSGGIISGNTAADFGGGVCTNGTFEINGKVNISGNTITDGSDNNLCLFTGKKISIGNDFNTSSTIGVNTEAELANCKSYADVTGAATKEISASFTADINGQNIVYEDGKVQLKGAHDWNDWDEDKRTCKVCQAEEVKCGENAGYTYGEETKTLTITGTGDMYNYNGEKTAPWEDVADKIEKVVISSGITSVGGNTFKGCTSLTDVDIPDTVTKIGEGAFEGCTSLEEVEIPDRVTSVGNNAFKGCTSLKEVEFKGATPPRMGEDVFEGADRLDKITVPEGSEDDYKEADGFEDVAGNITEGAPDNTDNGNTGDGDDNTGSSGGTLIISDDSTINSENISKDVELGENVPPTEIATPNDKLINAVLTPEELAEIGEDDEVKVVLQIDDAVSDEDKQEVESILETNGYLIAQYMNVSLFKVINGDRTQVTATNEPIRITFDIPEALRSPTRTFAMIRVHDGETTVLSDLDNDENTITIETDRFSTYALVYRENASAPNNNPATGVAIPLIHLTAVFAGVILAAKRKKKDRAE